MPQPSPIEPNQQDRGSNQRGYVERDWGRNAQKVRFRPLPPTPTISQLLAGILTGEIAKLV